MTREEKKKILEAMYNKCPNCLKPIKISKWAPIGKNRVYELIKSGELRSFVYQGGYFVIKDDLIEFLLDTCDLDSKRFHIKAKDEQND